jgi:hypothetical protein
MRATIRVDLPPAFTSGFTAPQRQILSTFRSRPYVSKVQHQFSPASRTFSSAARALRGISGAERAKELNQKGLDKQEYGFKGQIDKAIGQKKELETRTPWHREGSDKPPVKRARSASAMTKGLSISVVKE